MILEFASNILSSTLMDITNGNQLISDLLHHTLSFAKDMQFTSNQTVKWFSVANDVLIEALASETAPELSVCYTSFKNGLMQVFDDDATLFTVDDMEQMIKFFLGIVLPEIFAVSTCFSKGDKERACIQGTHARRVNTYAYTRAI